MRDRIIHWLGGLTWAEAKVWVDEETRDLKFEVTKGDVLVDKLADEVEKLSNQLLVFTTPKPRGRPRKIA